MRGRLVLAILFGATALASGIGLTAVAAWLIARAAEHPPVLTLMVAVVAVRTFGLSKGVLRYLERLLGHDVAFRALARLRLRVYANLTRLAPAGLSAFRRGELLTSLVDDVTAVQDRYARVLVPAWSAVMAAIPATAIASALLPAAGVILLTGLAVFAFVVPALSVGMAGRADAGLASDRAELSSGMVESLNGVEEFGVLGALPDQLARVNTVAGQLAAKEVGLAWTRGLAGAVGTVIVALTIGATLLAAAPATRAGELDGPAFAVLALLPLAAFEAMNGLVAAIRNRQQVHASLRRVDNVLGSAPPMTPLEDTREPLGHRVVVRDLKARWPGADRDSLYGIDLDLPPGKKVAIVGPSGSGKSTLLAALLRFCPATGVIEIGGTPLAAVPESTLRRTVGLAAADAHIFDSTIAANVRLARPDAADTALRYALRRAGLLAWVDSLPRGLETPVGEHGRNLSGGQRQRLALARALLADVPVLLCDEPDASLDVATADRLIADLLTAAEDRTVVIVSHRPESLAGVDEVLELDGGRVVERSPSPHRRDGTRVASYDHAHG